MLQELILETKAFQHEKFVEINQVDNGNSDKIILNSRENNIFALFSDEYAEYENHEIMY